MTLLAGTALSMTGHGDERGGGMTCSEGPQVGLQGCCSEDTASVLCPANVT